MSQTWVGWNTRDMYQLYLKRKVSLQKGDLWGSLKRSGPNPIQSIWFAASNVFCFWLDHDGSCRYLMSCVRWQGKSQKHSWKRTKGELQWALDPVKVSKNQWAAVVTSKHNMFTTSPGYQIGSRVPSLQVNPTASPHVFLRNCFVFKWLRIDLAFPMTTIVTVVMVMILVIAKVLMLMMIYESGPWRSWRLGFMLSHSLPGF